MRNVQKIALAVALLFSLTACADQPVKPEPVQNITIAFGGDTHGVGNISNFLTKGGDPLAGVAKVFQSADLSVLNLESAVTNQTEHQDKEYVFNSNPYLLDWMKTDGIDIVNIANNHAGDFWRPGLTETIKAIEDRNMTVIGAGKDDREAWTAKIVKVRGTKVAFLGIAKINGGVETVATGDQPGTTDGWDPTVIELAIKAAARQAKIVIVYVHWGVEKRYCPEIGDIASAQKWLEWGATAIIGSHPHRQQPAIKYGEKLVDYSLGNLAFYSQSGGGRESGIGYLTISPDGKVVDYQFMPAYIDASTGSPKLLSGEAKKAAIAKKQRSCSFLDN